MMIREANMWVHGVIVVQGGSSWPPPIRKKHICSECNAEFHYYLTQPRSRVKSRNAISFRNKVC